MDRPETRNAVDPAVAAGLGEGLEEAERGDARAVVITGGGGTFVSGGDLRVIQGAPFDETLALCQRMSALLDRFERSPLPVLAAVEGHAFGGGCELLLACDLRVASPGAKLSFRQVAMGVSTGWGGAARLARLVPRGTASRLLFGAEVLDAGRMQALGVVDDLAEAPLERCLALAERIATHPAEAVAGLKRVLGAAYGGSEEARRVEREVFAGLWGGPAHRAALDAYFRAREPE